MDIRTLPDAERLIYNSIRKQYSVTFNRLRIGEKTIRLLKITDIEEFLDGRGPFADVTSFPFWTHLWDGLMILPACCCRHLFPTPLNIDASLSR